MILLPVLPLVLGSLLVWWARNRRERVFWALTVGLALTSWVLILVLVLAGSPSLRLPYWVTAGGVTAELVFSLEGPGWVFTYLAATQLVSIALTGVVRAGAGSASARAMMLAFAGLAMLAMMAANLLAVVLAWALMDGVFFLLGRRPAIESGSVAEFITRLVLDGLGTLVAAMAAVFVWQQGTGTDLLDRGLAPGAVVALALAGLLRLGLLPPHFSLPALPGMRRGIGSLLRFLPAATVLCALARALGTGVPPAALPWLWGAGALGVAVGGVRWLTAVDLIEGRRFFVVAACSAGILGAAVAPQGAETILVAAGVTILLGGTLLSVAETHSRRQRMWPALGALMLAGVPFTPGSLALEQVSGQLLGGGAVGGILVVLGTAACCYGLLGIATGEITPWPVAEGLARLLYGVGLALPVVVGLGLGLSQARGLSLSGLLMSSATALAGIGLLLAVKRLAGRRLERARRIAAMLDPTPLYRAIGSGLAALAVVVRGITNVIEGQGAMLWTIVVVLLAWLAARD